MKVCHRFAASSAVFDDKHLVSCAGLVPVMTLAAQTGLAELLADKVCIPAPRIKSGSANPSPKLTTVIAGMCAGADSIDDLDIVRAGGRKSLFGGVYAPSTIGTLLREFTFGHARQLESVLREHLVALCQRVEVLPGSDTQVFIDIDSLLRPRLWSRQTGRLLRAYESRGETGPAQGSVPVGDHDQHPWCGAGDRRDAAARGQDRLR